MENLPRIQKVSGKFFLFFSILIGLLPLYHVFFWMFINQLPETLININSMPAPLVRHDLSPTLRFLGFLASLLPLSAKLYGVINLRRIFALYKEGIIFSYGHVECFRKSGIALILWMAVGIVYESVAGVLFTWGNPPGQRILRIEFGSADVTALMVGSIILVISWVMEEGRKLNEEQALTI